MRRASGCVDAVAVARAHATVPAARRYATVVTSAAGHPLDKTYYQTVKGMHHARELLAPGGRLLLKTFSHEDEGTGGPHRFHPDELDAVFGGRFERLELTKTIYQGTMPEKPKALFTVWRKTA